MTLLIHAKVRRTDLGHVVRFGTTSFSMLLGLILGFEDGG